MRERREREEATQAPAEFPAVSRSTPVPGVGNAAMAQLMTTPLGARLEDAMPGGNAAVMWLAEDARTGSAERAPPTTGGYPSGAQSSGGPAEGMGSPKQFGASVLPPDLVMALQQPAGNAAVARLVSGGPADGSNPVAGPVTPDGPSAQAATSAAPDAQALAPVAVPITALTAPAMVTRMPPTAIAPALSDRPGPGAAPGALASTAPVQSLDLAQATAAVVAEPTAADEGAQQVVAAVAAAGTEGQAALATAVDEQLGVVASMVEAQQMSIEQGGIAQLAAVDTAFAAAGGRLTAAIAAAQQRLQEAHQSEQERLATWSVEARQRLADGYATRTDQVRAGGVATGDEAVSAADTTAADTSTRVDDLAARARSAGAARAASPGGADAEAAHARAIAAVGVAGDTATQVSQSLGDTVTQLRGLGPETHAQLVAQANQIADQIRQQLPSVAAVLSQATEGAGSQLSQAVAAGSTTLAAFGVDLSNQLTGLQTTIAEAIRQQADAAKQSVYEAGQLAVVAGQAQHERAAQAGATLLDGILAGIANRRIRRAAAARLTSELSRHVQQGFGDAAQQARVLLAEIAQAFSETASSVLEVVQTSTDQAQQLASDTAAHGEEAVAGQATTLSTQFTALVAEVTGSGDRVVTGNLAHLDQIIADFDSRFGQVLAGFRQTLTQRAGETTERAREPLGTLDNRMDAAMREAEEATHRSWLENALQSIPWGTIAGVIVGLVVTIAVVALLGTGIGALIVAGALAGALSAAATTLTDNAVHGRDTNWSELGKQMVVGAAFGAIGGAIGGGVSGALGGTVERQLITEAGAVAVGKAANVVTGATLGVVNNVVAGRPWDEGLLVNIGMSMALSYGPGGRFIDNVTQNTRASMVDSGSAFNVTPAEMAASSARMQARTDVVPSAVEPEPVAVSAEGPTLAEGGVPAAGPVEERAATPGAADEETIPVADLPDGTVMYGDRPMSEAEARVMYGNARRDSPHYEVGVYRNSETGECIVVQGNSEFVDARAATNAAMREFLDSRPGEPGRWDLVEHSHPVAAATGVTPEPQRYPSGRGGDFDVARWQSGQSGGQPVEQTIGIVTERGNETVRYGYDPNDPQPYSLTYPGPDGTPVTQRFRSMEAYGEWYENQPGTGGGSPHIDGEGATAAAAPTKDDRPTTTGGATSEEPTSEPTTGLENRLKTEETLAGSEPVPARERPRSTQPPRESAQEQAQAAPAVEESPARPRTPDDEFAEFEKWLREEAGATGPLTSDKLVQLYRHGSRATVAKYLRRHLMEQAAKENVLELGEFTMKIKPDVPVEKQVDAFVKHLEGAHSMPQSYGNKLPEGVKYDADDALVILTDKPTHTAMDQPWKDAFNAIRKSGAKQATAQQVFDAVADGIRRTPGMAESEKAARIARLHDEMFVELGLVPGQPYDVPRIFTWQEILGFITKHK